jgi:Tfp pilus assembly protein PilX
MCKNFQNKKYYWKNNFQSGSILAYTLIMITIISIFLTASLKVVVSNMQFGINREYREEALQVAEAGVYFYRWYLAHQIAGLTKKQIRQFWNSGTAYGVASNYEDDFNGVGVFSIDVTPPESNSTIVLAEVTGWTYKNPNSRRTVKVRFRQPAWSEYSVLCDADIRFGAGTDVYGPIHSNGGIRFDAIAHNVVSSGVASYNDPDHPGGDEFGVHTHDAPTDPLPPNAVPARTDVFMAGREFPVPVKDFNSVLSDIADMKSEAGCANVGSVCPGNANGMSSSVNGIYFNNAGYGRHIVLRADDTMRVYRVTNYSSTSNEITNESSYTSYAIPDDGIIFVEDNVWVEGIVDGKKVTIAAADLSGGSDKDIYIKRDVQYTNYDGSDIIGLVAQRDVETTRDSEDNLRIDGALLAQGGRVGRDWYSGSHKDTITINGSIVTKLRYGFAYTDGTGYNNRNLIFDSNLLYFPPPYFPTGTDYAIDSWEEL